MRVISELTEADFPTPREDAVPLSGTQADTVYRISVRDLDVAWSIGVYDHEHHRMQPIRINLDLEAVPLTDWDSDDYAQVPCYAEIAERIQAMALEGHVKLVETLAHRIAELCLEDARILKASVRVEKPEALANAASVGVEVTHRR